MDSFEDEIKQVFLEEALQLLDEVEQCFLALENDPKNTVILDKIFRLAHNIKGSSKAVGFDELGLFAHQFESLLLKIKNQEIPTYPQTVNLLLRCNDHVKEIVSAYKTDLNSKFDSSSLIAEIDRYMQGNMNFDDNNNKSKSVDFDDSNVGTDVSNDINLAFEAYDNSLQLASVAEQFHESSQEKPKTIVQKQSSGDESIRVSLSRLDRLLNYVGELVILQTVLREQSLNDTPLFIKKTVHQIGKVTKEVQDLSMSMRMLPLKTTFQKMQRIVRDTASLLNRQVLLNIEGEETEVDKTVLEHLSDPLVHIIRNAVDHGIEDAEERKQKGKPVQGTIVLKAYHQSGKLVIEIKDDGRGLDGEKLKTKAIAKGILRPDNTLSDQEAIRLIFHPGFSTKDEVSEISGRGVGMDVVKTNIEGLKGEVLIDTELDKGSVFKIILPLTMAIIDAMIIRSNKERFVIPLAHVHETVSVGAKDLHYTTALGELLLLRGENIPTWRLTHLLGRKDKTAVKEEIALVFRTLGQPFAILIHDVIGQYQVVIKKLGLETQNIRGFSGSAILGDGKPALILEVIDLIPIGRKYKTRSMVA